MITEPTLLVLGAGASRPYEFPVARELKTDISAQISADNTKWKDRIQHLSPIDIGEDGPESDLSWERAEQFAEDFRGSPITSIDEFLENRREYRLVGKTSIALSLIPNERRDILFDDDDRWYTLLFNRMIEGIDAPDDICQNNIRIITYNYDRSFEEFFMGSLVNSYGMSRNDALELFENTFDLTHVYGKLGALSGENKRDYNHSISHKPLTTAIRGIDLMYEVKESQKRENIEYYVRESDKTIFMGFGYHAENLDLLSLDDIYVDQKSFWGTAKDLRTYHRGRVNELFDGYGASINLGNANFGCWQFLERTAAML